MASVHPLSLVWFKCGGRKRESGTLFVLSSGVDKPVGDAGVCDFCVSKLLEMGEYLLSFFLLGSFVCVMKIICGMDLGHCKFRPKGMTSSPLRKVFPAKENLNWDFSVFELEEPAVGCWSFPMAGSKVEEAQIVFSVLYIVRFDPGVPIG